LTAAVVFLNQLKWPFLNPKDDSQVPNETSFDYNPSW